jgi:hypothetical protein
MIWDNFGNILILGETGANVSATDALVIKYDTSGNQHWSSTYSNPNYAQDQVADIAVDANDNIYVCGNVYVTGPNWRDFQTFKMDSSGTFQWAKHYNDSLGLDDLCRAMAIDQNGEIIVTGDSYGWGPGYPVFEIATIKYDPSGNQQWVARYETSYSTALSRDVVTDASNNIYITGAAYDNITKFDCITMKYNGSGNQQWLKLINGTLSDADGGTHMIRGSSGIFYVAGYVENTTTSYDALIGIYDQGGNKLYHHEWNDSLNADDFFDFISLDNMGNIFASGVLEKLNDKDLLAVKFSSVNSINNESSTKLDFNFLPNPADLSVVISHGLLVKCSLRILDVAGREVFQSSAISLPSSVDVSNFENGIYFVQVTSENETAAQRIIIHH